MSSPESAPRHRPATGGLPAEPAVRGITDIISGPHAGAAPESLITGADLRAVLNGMNEGFALLGPDFTILDTNVQALAMDTRTRSELIGRTHWEVFPGSENSIIGQTYKRAMRDRVPVTLEHHYHWPDGRTAWLDMRAYPVAGGRLAVFYQDVSERHAIEQQLRESEARFRGAAEAFADVLWTNDADGRMTGDQPGWAAMTGQSPAEYQGFGWTSAVHPDDVPPTLAAWQVAVATRTLFAFEHRVRRRDGVWRHLSIHAVPVLGNDGSLREWIGVHHDITELSENEMRFRQIAENIDAVFYVNEIAEQRITYVSPAYERIWQQPAEALYADPRSFMRDLHLDDHAAVETASQRQLSGESTETRYRLVRPDGSIRHIHDRSFATRHLDSRALRIVGLAEDVTATTEALLLREIDHRVRNSRSIVLSLQSMQSRASDNAEVTTALTVAASRMHAIARVHERLYQNDTLGTVEFGAYLDGICRDLQTSLQSDGITLRVDTIPVELPVDQAVPLGLITNELVTNAFKHCGKGPVTISVALAVGAKVLRLTVSDTGVGMPANASPRTGLGIQVITALTRQLGGTMAWPAPGEAATFTLSLPLQPA